MRSRFARRWRSVSFRSGLWSALSVGVVAGLLLVGLVFLAFALFAVSDGIAQTSILNRADDQIRLGVEPGELDLPTLVSLASPDEDGTGKLAFWAVLTDDAIVDQGGVARRSVIDAEFENTFLGSGFRPEDGKEDVGGVKVVDGTDWLFVERRLEGPDGTDYRIVAATDGVFRFPGFLQSALTFIIPVALILMMVAMAVTSYLMRRALRRVERMRAEVEQISQESLDRRVPLVDADDGIDKLAITMNDMLERLQLSTDQQRQFLADASHELRSPVAGILAQLDIASTYPDRVDANALIPKLHGEAERLQALVNDLLFLSRSEAGEAAAATPVDIDTMLRHEQEHQNLLHDAITVELTAESGASVAGSQRDLERTVRNLVDNAVRHAESRVDVSSSIDDGMVVIDVRDDGPGIPADQHERIFERFVRLDEARDRDSGGAGLGLAITREIVHKHGGSVSVVPATKGSHFQLCLPLP